METCPSLLSPAPASTFSSGSNSHLCFYNTFAWPITATPTPGQLWRVQKVSCPCSSHMCPSHPLPPATTSAQAPSCPAGFDALPLPLPGTDPLRELRGKEKPASSFLGDFSEIPVHMAPHLCCGLAGMLCLGTNEFLHSSGERSKMFSCSGRQLARPRRGLARDQEPFGPGSSASPFLLAYRFYHLDYLFLKNNAYKAC